MVQPITYLRQDNRFDSPTALFDAIHNDGFGKHWSAYELSHCESLGDVGAKRHIESSFVRGQSKVFRPFPGSYVTIQSINILNAEGLEGVHAYAKDKFHVVFVISGAIVFEAGETKSIAGPGACVIHRNTPTTDYTVRFADTPKLEIVSFAFCPEHLDAIAFSVGVPLPLIFRALEALRPLNRDHLIVHEDATLAHFAQSIFNCSLSNGLWSFYLSSKISELFCLLLSNDQIFDPGTLNITSLSSIKRIGDALAFLRIDQEQFPSPIAVTDALRVDRRTLNADFLDFYGVSFNDYYHRIRFELAKARLNNTDESVTEIAYWAGYNHVANFSRAFQKHFGVAPRAARKQADDDA